MKLKLLIVVLVLLWTNQNAQTPLTTGTRGNFSSFTPEKKIITPELQSLTDARFYEHPEYGVLPYNAPCKDCFELLQKRDETHRYFVKEGTNGSEFYSQTAYSPLNYTDAAGILSTIDHRLKPTSEQGIFSALRQPFPVTVNLRDKYVSIKNTGKEILVNRKITISIKNADGSLTSLGTPSWTNYTAGDDGVVVHDLYPGIDLELHVGTGNVESFYRINKSLNLKGTALVIHDNMQLPSDLNYDFSYAEAMQNGLYEGSLFIKNDAGTGYFIMGSPAAYDENGSGSNHIVSLQYGIDKEKGIDLYVPISWMNDAGRSYPVLIDPFVTATSTLPAASITGSGYNATCFSGGCTYDLSVAVPAATIITDITTTFWYLALGSCALKQGAWDIKTGSCRYPTIGQFAGCNVTFPGACTYSDISCFNEVKSCITPSCQSYDIPFMLTFYRCVQPASGCGFSCVTVDSNTPWSVTVTGQTVVDFKLYFNSTDICNGVGMVSIDNVNPYSTYSWNTGQTGKTIKVTSPGTYIATVIDTNGCVFKDTAIVSSYPNCSGFLQLTSDSIVTLFDTVHVSVKIWGGAAVFSTYAKLTFDNTLLQYVSSSVGNYLGSNIITSPAKLTGNVIEFGMTKTNGQTGSYGDGVIYDFKFVIPNLPASIRVISTKPLYAATLFSLSSINVYNDIGNKPASFTALSIDTSYTYISNFANVWPGDLNNDYKVNVVDLLPIGYFYNQTGPARPNGNLVWKAQPSPLWGYDRYNAYSSAYMTFADGNADGIIGLADQAAIGFNLSRSHQRRSNDFIGYPQLQASNDPPLWTAIAEDSITENQLPYNLTVPLKLGTTSQPVSNLYGIAFDLYFDPICINTAAIGLNFTNFFGTLNNDYIRLVDSSEIKQGHISVSMTRFNTFPLYANGNEILNLTFKVIQSCGAGWFKVMPQVLACNMQDGTPIALAAMDDSVKVLGPLGLEEFSKNIGFEIYPNPNTGTFNIVINESIEEGEVLVYNVLGENVYKESLSSRQKEITVNAPAGVYLVQIRNAKTILTKKIILE